MGTEEEFNNLFNNVMEEMNLIHERTMNIKEWVSWGYQEEFNIQRHRHRMGGDEGIHLVISPEQDPLIQEGVKL
jgi:hypothetical protein